MQRLQPYITYDKMINIHTRLNIFSLLFCWYFHLTSKYVWISFYTPPLQNIQRWAHQHWLSRALTQSSLPPERCCCVHIKNQFADTIIKRNQQEDTLLTRGSCIIQVSVQRAFCNECVCVRVCVHGYMYDSMCICMYVVCLYISMFIESEPIFSEGRG